MTDTLKKDATDVTVLTSTGLDRLVNEQFERLRNCRVGVLCHAASVDRRLRHVIDLLLDRDDVDLTAIFGPQHGLFGETQDNMIEWEGARDRRTGVPVHSLYGEFRKPTAEMLSEIDVLVCDLQDVGARYYTYIWTLTLCLEACAALQKHVLVLDRPNPIGGHLIEGPVLDRGFRSFVGLHPLPIRHGLTVGEVAGYLNVESGLGCDLEVLRLSGWTRNQFFEETGLPWVLPSPNIPTPETAVVYPGLCLLEGTNVSEGRGTTRPFEISGAPWVDPDRLVEALRAHKLPGVIFRPNRFVPTFHKWAGRTIGGVQIHVTDREKYLPFRTGLALVAEYRSQAPKEFEWNAPPYEYEDELLPFDILCGTDRIRRALETGESLRSIENLWSDELATFSAKRKRHLLYS